MYICYKQDNMFEPLNLKDQKYHLVVYLNDQFLKIKSW